VWANATSRAVGSCALGALCIGPRYGLTVIAPAVRRGLALGNATFPDRSERRDGAPPEQCAHREEGDRSRERHDQASGIETRPHRTLPTRGERHDFDIAVAILNADGTVLTDAERVSYWSFTHDEFARDLESAGLTVETNTWTREVERYLLTARR
jgi:hypothetical protein